MPSRVLDVACVAGGATTYCAGPQRQSSTKCRIWQGENALRTLKFWASCRQLWVEERGRGKAAQTPSPWKGSFWQESASPSCSETGPSAPEREEDRSKCVVDSPDVVTMVGPIFLGPHRLRRNAGISKLSPSKGGTGNSLILALLV